MNNVRYFRGRWAVLFLFLIAIARCSFGAGVADEMVEIDTATFEFLESLDGEQLKTCNLSFKHASRVDWNYVPGDRLGLDMGAMSSEQLEKLDALLGTILSADGLEKSKGVLLCERVLYDNSGHSTLRDPSKYHLTVFGKPDKKTPWGIRFEGHHISLNYTFAGNRAVAAAPAFFGANPATILEGPNEGLRVLKDEEDLGRTLVQSLSAEQKKIAIFRETALREIVTRAKPEVSPLESVGIAYSDLNPTQQESLLSLIGEYIGWMPEGIAAARLQKVLEGGLQSIRFGWAGGIDKGDRHYYRVQGPSFLIEYDNYQGSGTHIHAVWRDFKGDFGRDLLREHYQFEH